MHRPSIKYRSVFTLTAVALMVFALPLAWTGRVCCQCATTVQRATCCQSTNPSSPCDCLTCAHCRVTSFAAPLVPPEQQLLQDDGGVVWSDTAALCSADGQVDASLHAPQPATALQRCVRFARLTL